jgi:F420-dependent oxidoreductase-like protein
MSHDNHPRPWCDRAGWPVMSIRIAEGSLVVLVGPPASGKSTWAASHFPPHQIVSSDELRAVVGTGEHDQRASKDAFDVLDVVVERRLKRGLTTVVDSLGTEAKRRRRWIRAAAAAGRPCVAVVFDTDAATCRARNRARPRSIPGNVMASMLARWPEVRAALADDGFAAVHPPGDVIVVAPDLVAAPAAAARQQEAPVPLEFGLQMPRFTFPGGPAETRDRLSELAAAAEGAGFTSIWVMDHFLQIPQVGPHWEDMLESWTTLAFLAGRTDTARLGTLVTGVTYRNIAHMAKIVATLDVLSGGRAMCGIGAAWFEREHRAYGWTLPPLAERFAMLEDALELLPLMWGKGAPGYSGRTIEVAEAVCYPRPLQDHVPILVGGSGERRTLKLVARHADACNLFGDPDTVRHKVEVLHRHCADEGRDPAEVAVTVLSTADAPSTEDHVGRYRAFAEAGVDTVIVNFPELTSAEPLTRFAEVIAAFRR